MRVYPHTWVVFRSCCCLASVVFLSSIVLTVVSSSRMRYGLLLGRMLFLCDNEARKQSLNKRGKTLVKHSPCLPEGASCYDLHIVFPSLTFLADALLFVGNRWTGRRLIVTRRVERQKDWGLPRRAGGVHLLHLSFFSPKLTDNVDALGILLQERKRFFLFNFGGVFFLHTLQHHITKCLLRNTFITSLLTAITLNPHRFLRTPSLFSSPSNLLPPNGLQFPISTSWQNKWPFSHY